ncbi:type II secretion system F family protein [Enemella sp. A6]|uniref:type II secretion system F family protein n=1 Tax=Enemella sp. A6 TaxID=3440152 RepID=UPI003EB9EE4A
MNTTWAMVVATGLLLGAGAFLIIGGLIPGRPSLAAALARLEGRTAAASPEPTGTRSQRLGAWLARHSPIPVGRRQQQRLRLQGITLAEFHARKLLHAVLGALVPGVIGGFTALLGVNVGLIPGGAALLGAVVGWFLPDLTLRREGNRKSHDAAEALFTFFDLVTLERLANASAIQALTNSAQVSDTPVFRQIRAALERARMEQRPPYDDLVILSERIGLPALADLAEVMRTDQHGAALADNLRSRVRELRDEHLTATKIAATEVSENMTLPMTIPALLFGLLFLTPPVLRLLSG